jgi:1,4-dihydroxy-2-naphthoyl-CoA hydrolase
MSIVEVPATTGSGVGAMVLTRKAKAAEGETRNANSLASEAPNVYRAVTVARLSRPVEISLMADTKSIPLLADLRRLATRGLGDALGIELLELTPERVVATMPVDQRTRQPFGILHGGASVALAETVASIGATANVDQAEFVAVGLEINANHLRAKSEGTITATATPIHVGRTTHLWDIRIVDEQGRDVCVSRCTLAIRPRA